ncbi:hypothetical protein QE152_g6382 [Popillia japonica]|uniref:Uncharacterized protein n=1 Tax=Popillia japonica TaxID=7064 RepID=A0AAW1MIJ9_POPJA
MIGCMRSTPLGQFYKAAGCRAPTTQRLAIEHPAKFRQTLNSDHPLFEAPELVNRLKLRKKILSTVPMEPPDTYPINQEPSPGSQLDWNAWKTLNRLGTGNLPWRVGGLWAEPTPHATMGRHKPWGV